jgi:hypothetical protein
MPPTHACLGVAWILTTGEEPSLAKINVVRNWGVKISEKVPSTLTYSPNKGEQWGHGIGDSAYVIQRTKLELEVPSREHALDGLRKTLLEDQLLEDFSAPNSLQNGIPFHLIKSPSDIVTDYLTHVAKCVRRDIESQKDKAHLKQFPIDYVITHPAEWDSRAKNLTFRSVKAAFDRVFREAAKKKSSVHLVTEPEACAQYTRRDAKEGTGVMSDLVPGECFIVVDAGGGTVVSLHNFTILLWHLITHNKNRTWQLTRLKKREKTFKCPWQRRCLVRSVPLSFNTPCGSRHTAIYSLQC